MTQSGEFLKLRIEESMTRLYTYVHDTRNYCLLYPLCRLFKPWWLLEFQEVEGDFTVIAKMVVASTNLEPWNSGKLDGKSQKERKSLIATWR